MSHSSNLNDTDFLHSFFEKLWEFYNENRKKVLSIGGASILVILIAVAWFTYKHYYEKDAWSRYAKIDNSITGSPLDDEQLIKQFKNLSSNYSGSEAALLSDYRLGNLHYKKKDLRSAIHYYQKFINQASDRNDLKVLSYSGLAYSYEAGKDYQKALTALQEAEKIQAGKNFETFIYRDMGRIYEEMNNRSEALKYYKKALGQTIDPAVTLFIKRKIALLS